MRLGKIRANELIRAFVHNRKAVPYRPLYLVTVTKFKIPTRGEFGTGLTPYQTHKLSQAHYVTQPYSKILLPQATDHSGKSLYYPPHISANIKALKPNANKSQP